MPQLNKVTITVAGKEVSYTPRGISPQTGVATLSSVATTPEGANLLTLSLNAPTGNRVTYRPRVKLFAPQLANKGTTEAPEYSVSRSASANVDFTFSKSSTLSERKEVVTSLIALLQDTLVVDMVENLNGVY